MSATELLLYAKMANTITLLEGALCGGLSYGRLSYRAWIKFGYPPMREIILDPGQCNNRAPR